jgi:hypothetical protein
MVDPGVRLRKRHQKPPGQIDAPWTVLAINGVSEVNGLAAIASQKCTG